MDESILRAVNRLAEMGPVAIGGWFLSSAVVPAIVFAGLLASFVARRRYAAILAVALAAGGTDVLVARIMKPAFGRERPCRALTGLVEAAECGVGKSFPSGHAGVSFAVLFSAAPAVPLGWWILAPLAGSVAASRVLLGVHYPSDVLGGAAVGSTVGLLATLIRRRLERRSSVDSCSVDS